MTMLEHAPLLAFLFIFVMIYFASFVDCIAGGGGLITIPTYLAVGVPSNLILGTNKIVMMTGTLTAVLRLLRSVKVYWRSIGFGIVTSIIGGWCGVYLSHYLSQGVMTLLLLIIIPAILAISYFKPYIEKTAYSLTPLYFLKLALICLVIGGYDGFFGPGTGTFLFLAFMYVLSMSAREAVTNAKIINLCSNVSAGVHFLIIGAIAWKIVLVALPASVLGYLTGAHYVLKADVKRIKLVVTMVLLILMLKLIVWH